MKAFPLIALLAVAIIAVVADDAIDAKDADFDEVVSRNALTLVKFYAPWCGHCKRIAPEWDKAATALVGKAGLVRVDCTTETAVAQKFGIQGYPTIKVFREGQLVGDYDAGRTSEAIVQYVISNSGPAVTVVSSADELEVLKKESPIVVVVFSAEEGTTSAVTHAEAAKTLRSKYRFVRVADATLFDGASDSIVIYKQFDEGRVPYTGDVSKVADLTAFLSTTSVRVFDEIGPENYKMYMERGLPIAWLFVKPSADNFEALKTQVSAVASAHQGQLSVVWVDADKYGAMAERLGVRKGAFPAFVVDRSGEHFVLAEDKEISTAIVGDFVTAVLADTLKPTIRSTEAPEEHTKDGLTTVVGSTFDDLVINSGKDVLIEFYAPWCGHCKKLQPTFEQVAKELKDVDGIRIAQIDAGENDFNTKLFTVSGFPTLYFVPANGSPKLFEGSRSVMGILNFLKEASSVTFELPSEDRAEL
ncbi:protein disulfide isomerase, putative [Bodo saltans]|uniref:Protein disulfide-isomerase n=1 Tax=Bodo saltans TaxID=75058 RepID=A0A0S4KL52_BODSA|nr:protein disulfide isomerase, putative [Bodo saltans]|eukprot:CUI15335.1 protein disulfide isomerase, putative [Bodo saltans]